MFAPLGGGTYTATVAANGIQALLRASAVATATVWIQGRSGALGSGATVDFGRIQKGHSSTLEIRISNATTGPVSVGSVAVTGSAFRVTADNIAPVTLAPGEGVSVPIVFEPSKSGTYTGALAIDARLFTLTGVGYDPPLPAMTIVAPDYATSLQQQTFAIRFDAASETSGTGTVVMEFQPAPGLSDDPAIRFVSPGGRKASFRVEEGATTGAFATANELTFQTGTTAGAIVFTVTLGNQVQQKTVSIAPARVQVDHASAARRVSDIDVSVAGYDNTRTVGPLAFTFFDQSGNVMGGGAIWFDATSQFQTYFAGSQVGGAFLFRATFPVTGDATQISAVEVQMTSSPGATVSQRLAIP